MAANKKSFLLYADLIHSVKKLPRDLQGDLFMCILEYVNDLDPKPKDLTVDVFFETIKQQLKRDLKHWENVRKVRSDNGKLGGRPPKAKKPNALLVKQTKAKKAVNVNVNVTDTVNDIDKDLFCKNLFARLTMSDQILNSRRVFKDANILIDDTRYKELARQFVNEQLAADNIYNPLQTYVGHFNNWVKKKK